VRLLLPLAIASTLAAQSTRIEIYSEFQRVDPFGRILPTDQPQKRREILSPALLRNGFGTFTIAVTAPQRESYFLFTQSFPQNLFEWKIYEQKFVPHQGRWIPDTLEEARHPFFGAMPDPSAKIDGQTTRVYLLDVRVPKELPSQPARLEMLMKSGTWRVAPMELRILHGTFPETTDGEALCQSQPHQPLAALARCMVEAYLDGKNPPAPPHTASTRDAVARNIAQDLALARSIKSPQVEDTMRKLLPKDDSQFEWYLRLRAFLIRLASK
jgi:hypothetical protein